MGPKTPVAQSSEFLRQPLCEMLNAKYPLVKLADVIDWEGIERSIGTYFQTTTGRPVLSPRLVAGLVYLPHAYDRSDEAVLNTWVKDPYVQYCTAETYFQTETPIDSSSLTRWRKRISEEGGETLLIGLDSCRPHHWDDECFKCGPVDFVFNGDAQSDCASHG